MTVELSVLRVGGEGGLSKLSHTLRRGQSHDPGLVNNLHV